METSEKRVKNQNNHGILVGEILTEPEVSHEVFFEKFYDMVIGTPRRGNRAVDKLHLQVPERLCDVRRLKKGTIVRVEGSFRSHRVEEGEKRHLRMFFFAESVEFAEDNEEIKRQIGRNQITLNGFICNDPIVRTTPKGYTVGEVLFAANRITGRSDYLHLILWERNALYIGNFDHGTQIEVFGRIQSRDYQKDGETKTAYEISVRVLNVIKGIEREHRVEVQTPKVPDQTPEIPEL